jgi:hypothetical protein
MRGVFDILILLALASVVVTLLFGVYTLRRGGEFSQKYSNKLMRLRIALQLLAVGLIIAAFAWKASGHS